MNTTGFPIVVLMGPSGCGKTAVGRALAGQLRCRFVEGDDLHSPANVAKMRAGVALTDEDRRPWLDAIAAEIAVLDAGGAGGVVSCSALKHRYRLRLADAAPVMFVLPQVPHDVLVARVTARAGHYMPSGLVASQLATLEPPVPGEDIVEVDGTLPIAALVERVVAVLNERRSEAGPDP